MLKILRKLENFELIKQEVFDLVNRVGFQGPYKNQIICQSLVDDIEDWETGIGSVEELEVQKGSINRLRQQVMILEEDYLKLKLANIS
jgi:hypothetical protein